MISDRRVLPVDKISEVNPEESGCHAGLFHSPLVFILEVIIFFLFIIRCRFTVSP